MESILAEFNSITNQTSHNKTNYDFENSPDLLGTNNDSESIQVRLNCCEISIIDTIHF